MRAHLILHQQGAARKGNNDTAGQAVPRVVLLSLARRTAVRARASPVQLPAQRHEHGSCRFPKTPKATASKAEAADPRAAVTPGATSRAYDCSLPTPTGKLRLERQCQCWASIPLPPGPSPPIHESDGHLGPGPSRLVKHWDTSLVFSRFSRHGRPQQSVD